MSILYDNIRSLCDGRSIKDGTLCRESGVPRSTLQELKSGRTESLSLKNLQKIADYFGITVSELTGESPSPAGDPELYDLDAKEKALLSAFNELTEEGKDLSIEYTQMLGTQNKYKKFALQDAESVG